MRTLERERERDAEGTALRVLFADLNGAKWNKSEGWPPKLDSTLHRMDGVSLSKSSTVVKLKLDKANLQGVVLLLAADGVPALLRHCNVQDESQPKLGSLRTLSTLTLVRTSCPVPILA